MAGRGAAEAKEKKNLRRTVRAESKEEARLFSRRLRCSAARKRSALDEGIIRLPHFCRDATCNFVAHSAMSTPRLLLEQFFF